MLALLFSLALCVAPHPNSHPNSHSSSRVVVTGRHIELQFRCQSLSLAESIAGIDRDGNKSFNASELRDAGDAIANYVLAHYELFPDGVQAAPLPGVLVDWQTSMTSDSAFAEQLVDARFEFTSQRDLERLSLRVAVFRQANPYHRDTATIVWNDDAPASWLFGEIGRAHV